MDCMSSTPKKPNRVFDSIVTPKEIFELLKARDEVNKELFSDESEEDTSWYSEPKVRVNYVVAAKA